MPTAKLYQDSLQSFDSPQRKEAKLAYDGPCTKLLEYSMPSEPLLKFSIEHTLHPLPHFIVKGIYFCSVRHKQVRVPLNEPFYINNCMSCIRKDDRKSYVLCINQISIKSHVQIPLASGINPIGRRYNNAAITIGDQEISRYHLNVYISNDEIFLENVSKSGGVFTQVENPEFNEDSSLKIRMGYCHYIMLLYQKFNDKVVTTHLTEKSQEIDEPAHAQSPKINPPHTKSDYNKQKIVVDSLTSYDTLPKVHLSSPFLATITDDNV